MDVAVVGGGPAGLAAAVTAAEAGAEVALFDSLAPGGSLLNLREIPGWPGFLAPETGIGLAGRLTVALTEAGGAFRFGTVRALRPGEVESEDGTVTRAARVVVATGCDYEPFARDGVGISHCATCDGPLARGQRVAVLGGDEWAAHEALVLSEYADHVTLVAPVLSCGRKSRAALEERANVTLAAELGELEVRTVFVTREGPPRTGLLPESVRRAENGKVPVGDDGQTSEPGIYAVGSVSARCAGSVADALLDGASVAARL